MFVILDKAIKNNKILLHVPGSGAALEHTSLCVRVVNVVFVLTSTSDDCFKPQPLFLHTTEQGTESCCFEYPAPGMRAQVGLTVPIPQQLSGKCAAGLGAFHRAAAEGPRLQKLGLECVSWKGKHESPSRQKESEILAGLLFFGSWKYFTGVGPFLSCKFLFFIES